MKLSQRFAQAGKELVKANFGNVIKTLSYSEPVNPSSYREVGNGMWFFGNDGVDHWFNFNGSQSAIEAYRKCAPVTAIINRKAQSFINGKTQIINTAGNESQSPQAKQLRKLLVKPNAIQNWDQFEAQLYIYMQIFGYAVILPIKPFGFPNIDATSLWNIPPHMLEIEESEEIFYRGDGAKLFKKITLVYKNTRVNLDPESLWIMKDFTPSLKSVALPESRLCSLEMPVNNIMGAYESRNVLINRRGAQGIFSSDKQDQGGTVALTKGEKEALQEDYRQFGLLRKQWQIIISNAAVKWQNMGYATRDLMLFEEIEDDIMRVCDSYNYPYPLLSSNRTNSLGGNNIGESKTLLYQDAIMPEAASIYTQWNLFLGLADYNLSMVKDYSHIAALKEDKVKLGMARFNMNRGALIEFQNNIITPNEWRALNGDDKLSNGFGDMYYYELLAQGIVFAQAAPAAAIDNSSTTNDNSGGQNNA